MLSLGKFQYACGLDGKYCLNEGCRACGKLFMAAPRLLRALNSLVGRIERDLGQSLDIANALKWPQYREALEAIAEAEAGNILAELSKEQV